MYWLNIIYLNKKIDRLRKKIDLILSQSIPKMYESIMETHNHEIRLPQKDNSYAFVLLRLHNK